MRNIIMLKHNNNNNNNDNNNNKHNHIHNNNNNSKPSTEPSPSFEARSAISAPRVACSLLAPTYNISVVLVLFNSSIII